MRKETEWVEIIKNNDGVLTANTEENILEDPSNIVALDEYQKVLEEKGTGAGSFESFLESDVGETALEEDGTEYEEAQQSQNVASQQNEPAQQETEKQNSSLQQAGANPVGTVDVSSKYQEATKAPQLTQSITPEKEDS